MAKKLRMEIEFDENTNIFRGDLLFLEFYEVDGEPRVHAVVTRRLTRKQDTLRADVLHPPTRQNLY